jgi:hypothetical protein
MLHSSSASTDAGFWATSGISRITAAVGSSTLIGPAWPSYATAARGERGRQCQAVERPNGRRLGFLTVPDAQHGVRDAPRRVRRDLAHLDDGVEHARRLLGHGEHVGRAGANGWQGAAQRVRRRHAVDDEQRARLLAEALALLAGDRAQVPHPSGAARHREVRPGEVGAHVEPDPPGPAREA